METRGTKHTLSIRNVQNEDFGNYSCVADNSLGRAKKYMELSGMCTDFFLNQYFIFCNKFGFLEIPQFLCEYQIKLTLCKINVLLNYLLLLSLIMFDKYQVAVVNWVSETTIYETNGLNHAEGILGFQEPFTISRFEG